jgi:hypothetical protein
MTRVDASVAARLAPRSAGAHRLTDVERAERRLTEADFSRQVTDLAVALGWSWVHFRPAQTKRGWRTPVEGPLGAGWPDLVLARARGRDRRLLFVELKRELGQLTDEQQAVRQLLLEIGLAGDQVDVALWRPSDLRDPIETSRIYGVLR